MFHSGFGYLTEIMKKWSVMKILSSIFKAFIPICFCLLLTGCSNSRDRHSNSPDLQVPKIDVPIDSPGMSYDVGENTEQESVNTSFRVNVYLENSGSMNGYVDGGTTDFQHNIFNYLDDVEQWLGSQLNLFFINSRIIPQGNMLDDYINRLTPSDFRNSGGSTATTDIADLFASVLEHSNDSIVSILISDCIFSPGNLNNPSAYLGNQQVKIKRAFEKYLSDNSHHDIAVMVYQMFSDFKGTYYDYLNTPHSNYQGKRPYYIWVIGHPLKIASMRLAIPESRFLHKVENFWFISSSPFKVDKYSILPNPKKGSFNRENNNGMSRMRKDNNGEFMFTIGADLGLLDQLLGKEYLLETNHYARIINKQVSDDWYISVTPNTISNSPATHNISLSTQGNLPQGDFDLAVCRKKPNWADESTDMDDRVLDETNQTKTYGLNVMFDGMVQAFTAKYGDYYTIMNIKMK